MVFDLLMLLNSGNNLDIKEFVNNALDTLSFIEFFISIATLITALKFKDRLKGFNSKKKFMESRNSLLNKLTGNKNSILEDNLYNSRILMNILGITIELESYSFFSKSLKRNITTLKKDINLKYLPDITDNKQLYKEELIVILTEIIAKIEQEEPLI